MFLILIKMSAIAYMLIHHHHDHHDSGNKGTQSRRPRKACRRALTPKASHHEGTEHCVVPTVYTCRHKHRGGRHNARHLRGASRQPPDTVKETHRWTQIRGEPAIRRFFLLVSSFPLLSSVVLDLLSSFVTTLCVTSCCWSCWIGD